jgi:hypothetical protein
MQDKRAGRRHWASGDDLDLPVSSVTDRSVIHQKGASKPFGAGDTILEPHHGVGVVTDIREPTYLGKEAKTYHSIQLLTELETS